MPVRYDKLFDLLNERNIKKGKLQEDAELTSSIIARLGNEKNVRVDTIEKICKTLRCQPGDIMEYYEISKSKDKNNNIYILETIPHANDVPDNEVYEECEYYDTTPKELIEHLEKKTK